MSSYVEATLMLIDLWIDSEYAEDVESSPYQADYDEEHSAYCITIPDADPKLAMLDWGELAEHLGFQAESVVYCYAA